jgi:hypothetical protein
LTPARRLIVALVWLVVFDQFVPGVLRRAERHRYEETQALRFESSDLFALGPFVSYLRDHPRGDRPRTVFLGNSVMFGFDLRADEAVPGRFQVLHPDTQVFNAAVNGFDLGSNYLVAKAIIDSVDRFYVMRGTAAVHPRLASLIPVDAADARAFHLETPDPIESRLQSVAEAWRLYGSTYRLQAALFGTSTREYVHLHSRPPVTRTFASQDESIGVTRQVWASNRPPGTERRAELRRRDELLWAFAELISGHRKHAVFLQIGAPAGAMGESEIADFNSAFAPYVEIVGLTIPPGLLYDSRHLIPIGARRVAEALTP